MLKHLLPVVGGGHHLPGVEQEREPFPGPVGLGLGGAFPDQQLGALPLGALPGGEVHHEGHPAQRVGVDHRAPDQDRYPVPVTVHVFLLQRRNDARPPQLRDRGEVAAGVFRGGDRLIGQAPRLQVLAAVADEVEEEVIRLVDPLLAADDHTERVGLAQPAEQGVALPQGRLHPALLGQVGEHHVGALRTARLVPGLGYRGDLMPADLARAGVRHADDHVGDHLPGAQDPAERQVLRPERGAILVHRPPDGVQWPGGHLGLRQAVDPPRRGVRAEHGPVSGVVDDTLRHGLEQPAKPLLRHRELGRRLLQLEPPLDVGGDIGGVQQDPRDVPVGVTDRLAHVIKEQLLGVLLAAEPDGRLAAVDGLPGFHDLVEYVHPVGQFREGLVQRPAKQIPVAYQPEACLVGEIDDQVGPGQVGHSGGQAREQFLHESKPVWCSVPTWDRNRDLRTPPAALNAVLCRISPMIGICAAKRL